MPNALDYVRRELARAHEDVLDAFGHVSVGHPDDLGAVSGSGPGVNLPLSVR